MRRVDIRKKLDEIECPVSSITLGDFDRIGELTAKKFRSPDDVLYKSVGCSFRPNFERGILIASLIKRFSIKTMLEIGFGRGYSTFCAAKAMADMGWDDGKIYSIDPNLDENHLKILSQAFPKEWFKSINLIKGTINDALAHISGPFELVLIDGDHRYDYVKHDWISVCDKFTKFVLFDDFDPKENANIQVKKLVDEIQLEKELIITDRRIFFDDRRIPDEDINYGMVLIKEPNFDASSYLTEW